MDPLYILPSIVSSIFLASIIFYLLLFKISSTKYIFPLALFCIAVFLWNIGSVLTNVTEGNSLWAKVSTLGLIFFPSIIFHFSAEYTGFFKSKYYLIGYTPSLILAILLITGFYVTGIDYRGYGFEPTYDTLLFYINSWTGLFLTMFSTFILYKYYKESVGIKKRQVLFILFAIPANSFLSFISYELMVEIYNIAQFPVGSTLDFIMIGIILYAVIRFKLPIATAAEIDFRILAETASEGICIIDQRGNIDYCNEYFCQLIGLPSKKVLGKPFAFFLSKKSQNCYNKSLIAIQKGEKIFGLELYLIKVNATSIAAEANTSPIFWNNELIGSFITIHNIQERKEAERALQASEEKYRTLTENISAGIYRNSGPEDRFIEANQAIIRMFGYKSKEDFLEVKVTDLYVNPNERKKFNEKMIKNGFVKNEELCLKKKDGALFWASVTAVSVVDEKGNIQYYDGVIEDITLRKKAEEEAKIYQSLLRHDMGNRNQVISGYLDMLLETGLSDEQRGFVEKALQATRASSELIQKLRDLERVKSERVVEGVSVDAVVGRIVKQFSPVAGEKGIEVVFRPSGIVVSANSLLEDVFSNLVQNAIDHSGCRRILVSSVREGDLCRVSVEDDGRGLPEEVRGHVFDKWVKGKESEGTGIGLHLVRSIVEGYRGRVEVRDRGGGGKRGGVRGTVFDVYIPVAGEGGV